MIAIDSEVVLAFLKGHGQSRELVISEAKKSGVYIPYTVLFELADVLSSLDKARVIETFSAILQTSGLIVENGPVLADALETFRGSDLPLTDCMKRASATAAGVTHFHTMHDLSSSPRDLGQTN